MYIDMHVANVLGEGEQLNLYYKLCNISRSGLNHVYNVSYTV